MKETIERTTMWMSEREMKSAIPETWMETLELPARSTKHEIPSIKHQAEDSARYPILREHSLIHRTRAHGRSSI